MQTTTHPGTGRARPLYGLVFLILLLAALPAHAQQNDVTFTVNQNLNDLTFTEALAIGNNTLFATGDNLVRYDLDADGQATFGGTIPVNGFAVSLAATDAFLIVGTFNSTLAVFDITDPANPVERSTTNAAGVALEIVARGNVLAATPDTFGPNVVELFTIDNNGAIVRVGQYQPGAFAAGLFLSDDGTQLLVATENALEVVDVSNPAQPVRQGSINLDGRGDTVTLLGDTAFVGSQGPDGNNGEPTGWFLEAIDVSNPATPQRLAGISDTNGPIHDLVGLEAGFLIASFRTGLLAFVLDETTGAFKVANNFTSVGGLNGTGRGSVVALEGLPENCVQLFTREPPTSFVYGEAGISAENGVTGIGLKLPPGSTGNILTTSYFAPPRVECPTEDGAPVLLGGGAVTAEGPDEWTLQSMTFAVETASQNASLREEFVSFIELRIGGATLLGTTETQERTVQNPATKENHTLNYITEIEFTGIDLLIPGGTTQPYTIDFIPSYPASSDTTNTAPLPCSVLEPVKRQVAQLSIHGVNDVGVVAPPNGEQLPNTELVVGVIDQACVINVTPDPDVGFGFIQAGIDGASNGDRIGVCPGEYREHPETAFNQTGRTVFSFQGPQVTSIVPAGTVSVLEGTDGFNILGEGTTVQGFTLMRHAKGIDIRADNVLIGPAVGAAQGAKTAAPFPLTLCTACNVIVGSEDVGVLIRGDNATLSGNYVGTLADGQTAFANEGGIDVSEDARQARILNNLISGNSSSGVSISGDGTLLAGNSIGLDNDARNPVPNQEHGITISKEAEDTTIGDPAHENVIAANGDFGIILTGGGIRILNTTIGLNRFGATEGNGEAGIFMSNAADIRIGGTGADSSNVIGGNKGDGILYGGIKRLTIQGNLIGVNRLGDQTGNELTGISSLAFGDDPNEDVVIGGVAPGARNIISGNGDNGITLTKKGDATILGNLIGVGASGRTAAGNKGHGISINITDAARDQEIRIGGQERGAGNIISGNERSGIDVFEGIATICGNYIGMDRDGLRGIGNGEDGITVGNKAHAFIGGKLARLNCAPNLIGDNGDSGILVFAKNEGTIILDNLIGIAADSVTSVRNTQNGIKLLEASDVLVSGNTVQGHQSSAASDVDDAGIRVVEGRRITLSDNVIRQNSFGVVILDTSPVDVFGNMFSQNTTCALVENVRGRGIGTNFFFGGNFLKDCNGASTGLHLTDVENAVVSGNQFENNTGAGVMIDGASSGIVVLRNNFIDNPEFGVRNDAATPIVAQGNFWGDASGPAGAGTGTGDAVSTGIDFGGFLADKVSVVLAAPDTAAAPIDAEASVAIFVQNFADMAGTLTLTVRDERGWLAAGSPHTVAVTLTDSLGATVDLALAVPAGTPDGETNRVTVEAVSDIEPAQADTLTFILLAGDAVTVVGVEAGEAVVPVSSFALSAAYPNPFNPRTQFSLQVGQAQRVRVEVYDLLGRRVQALYDGTMAAQQQQRFVFDAAGLPSGLYLIRVQGVQFSALRRVLLLK